MALSLALMVLKHQKNLKPTQFYMPTPFVSTTFPKNQALGSSLLSAYSWLSLALDLAQMVLEVRKNPKPTQFYMLNIFGFYNCPKKSSPGGVLALSLLLAVYGPGLGPDGPGCLEKP